RPLLDRGLNRGAAAPGEPGLSRRVERSSKRIVERAQPDLVAGGDLPACADEARARPPLFRLDDGAEDPLECRVQASDERTCVVEAAPGDAHHHLRTRSVERLALKLLDRFTADLTVEVPRARSGLETGERRLVRGPPGHDDEPAAAGGAGGAERDRLSGAAGGDTPRDGALPPHLLVAEHRPLPGPVWGRGTDEVAPLPPPPE